MIIKELHFISWELVVCNFVDNQFTTAVCEYSMHQIQSERKSVRTFTEELRVTEVCRPGENMVNF